MAQKFKKQGRSDPYSGEVVSRKRLISIALGFRHELPDSGNLEDIN